MHNYCLNATLFIAFRYDWPFMLSIFKFLREKIIIESLV